MYSEKMIEELTAAAQSGDREAKLRYADLCIHGDLNVNEERRDTVLRFLQELVLEGEPHSCLLLGELFFSGFLIDRDFDCALQLFQMAEDNGANVTDAGQAEAYLGTMYLCGFGTEKDERQALDCFLKGALLSMNAECILRTAEFFREGKIVLPDDSMAFYFYLLALECAEENAAVKAVSSMNVADYMLNGKLYAPDPDEALVHLDRAYGLLEEMTEEEEIREKFRKEIRRMEKRAEQMIREREEKAEEKGPCERS